MLLAKNNLFRSPKGLAYIINDGLVSFNDTNIEMDADEYQRQTQRKTSGRGRPSQKSREAEEWLQEYLSDGPKPSGNRNNPEPGTVFGGAVENGFKCPTIWRAADELGVYKRQEQFSRRWLWSLNEIDLIPDQKAEEYFEFKGFA